MRACATHEASQAHCGAGRSGLRSAPGQARTAGGLDGDVKVAEPGCRAQAAAPAQAKRARRDGLQIAAGLHRHTAARVPSRCPNLYMSGARSAAGAPSAAAG